MTAWQEIGELEVGGTWLFFPPCEGEYFRFEQSNPPKAARLDLAQYDGQALDWRPGALIASRENLTYQLAPPSPMPSLRRIGIRLHDPSLFIRNWKIRLLQALDDDGQPLRSPSAASLNALSQQLTTLGQAIAQLQQGQVSIITNIGTISAYTDSLESSLAAIQSTLNTNLSAILNGQTGLNAKLDRILAGGAGTGGAGTGGSSGQTQTFTFTSFGDTAGILYWIGTQKGTAAWQNPQSQGLTITTSSRPDYSPLSTITDRQGGNWTTNSVEGESWVGFDFGAGLKVRVSDITFRNNLNWTFDQLPRSFRLSGSNDGGSWTEIATMSTTTDVNAGAWNRFTNTTNASNRYRYIKISNTRNASPNLWPFSEIEFYGQVEVS